MRPPGIERIERAIERAAGRLRPEVVRRALAYVATRSPTWLERELRLEPDGGERGALLALALALNRAGRTAGGGPGSEN
jgi:hypothetical protein